MEVFFFLHATWSTQDMQDYQATLARARNPAGFLIVKLSEMEKVPFWDVGKKSRLMCEQFRDLASMRLLAEIHKFTRERVIVTFGYHEEVHRSLGGHQYGTRPYYRSPRGRSFVDLCGVFNGKIWLMVVLTTNCGGLNNFSSSTGCWFVHPASSSTLH